MIQPVTTITSSSGQVVPVYWSTGNFISTMDTDANLIGGIAKVTLVKDAAGSARVDAATFTPIVAHRAYTVSSYGIDDESTEPSYNPDMTSAAAGKKKAVADSFDRPLALTENEKAVLELAKAHSSKVVVLLNTNNPIEIEDLKNDEAVGAIVWCGEPGMDGFLGVADVLCGAVNPSGHLSDTYAVSSVSAPAMTNFGVYLYTNNSNSGTDATLLNKNCKGDWYLVESEGIYTGYKYYETRYEDLVLGQANADSAAGAIGKAWNWDDEVSYSFGYGLSYTTFEQTLKSVDVTVGGEGKAVVTVKNTGDVAGKSVAQLYVQAPYKQGGLEKAAIQLVAFEKTGVLEPGASEDLTITFDPAYFASFDENAVKANGTQGAWVLEDGDYYFAIGNGAHEALNNVLAAKLGSEDGLVKTAEREEINPANAIVWNLAATDMETYSVNVENQLQDMDINHFIEGTVENSVLFRGVRIAPDAHVKNCIIMQDGQVHSGAYIENCILDKQAVIKRNARLIGPGAYPIVIAKNVVI